MGDSPAGGQLGSQGLIFRTFPEGMGSRGLVQTCIANPLPTPPPPSLKIKFYLDFIFQCMADIVMWIDIPWIQAGSSFLKVTTKTKWGGGRYKCLSSTQFPILSFSLPPLYSFPILNFGFTASIQFPIFIFKLTLPKLYNSKGSAGCKLLALAIHFLR
jgi:hypothetical protein